MTQFIKVSQFPFVLNALLDDTVLALQNSIDVQLKLKQILALTSDMATCQLASTGNLTATYNNGTNGIGATLTNAGPLVPLMIDGTTVNLGDRLLIKNQSMQFQNGIYDVTIVGNALTAWKLTRSGNYNSSELIHAGDFFTVIFGIVNAKTQWIQTQIITTIGTNNIIFESNIVAGSGIIKTNNIISSVPFFTWNHITGVSATLISQNGYVIDNAGLVVLTLPLISNLGDMINIVGKGAGGFTIAQNAGQLIHLGSQVTTIGVAGSISSTNQYDNLILTCITANIEWTIQAPVSGGFIIV